MQVDADMMENDTEFPQKLKIEWPYDPEIPLLGIYPEKNWNTNSKIYMHPSVHSHTIYNNKDMEVTQVPINRWMV